MNFRSLFCCCLQSTPQLKDKTALRAKLISTQKAKPYFSLNGHSPITPESRERSISLTSPFTSSPITRPPTRRSVL